ncbi:Tetraspanin-6 [Oopsacas minuta]|uniref:Tetraspanin n=1 Tax=Oopsacas minuta TaxID=111878 RepID=A0AAV7K1F0_9METZ|nr:Tetraspanin-6 [Oopsacas minuta]
MRILTILKTYLFFFNIFLWIVAVALLAGVAYYFYAADQYKGVAENRNILAYTVVPLVVLVLAAIMLFVVSVLGLIAICFNVRVLIILYGILLACVIAAQLAGGVFILFVQRIVLNELVFGFEENLPTYNASIAFTTAVDTIQRQQMCCGVNSYADWENIGIPESCCISAGCTPNESNIYTDGCLTKLSTIILLSAGICCWEEQDESVLER